VGIDPQSFVHATALATAIAMTLICLVPLLAVNEPPLLPLVQLEGMADMQDSEAQLRTTLYSLIWAVPASFLAVGYPRRRTFREARERLSLVRPSLRQVVLAVLIVAGLLLVMDYLSEGIELVWNERGWRTTDAEAIELLFGFVVGPVGAVITSIVAGLGEELVFRGVLQPRLGIFLPALMFTSVHAFQYDFDALVQVLFLGVILGYIRKRTNTTTSAIVHGGYDLALFLEVVS
jgi:membrane protease YdiL (CAAX protease family)